jgi:hypothetical protein
MAAKRVQSVDPLRLVSALIQTSKVDTVYRDDLMGLGRDDDSDAVLARFAVARRERMVAW